MFQSQRTNRVVERILQLIVLAYQGLAVVLFLLSFFVTSSWLQMPFIGAFVEHTMVFNGVGPTRDDPVWDLYRLVPEGSQLVAVAGTEVMDWQDVRESLRSFQPGTIIPVRIQLDPPNGEFQVLDVTLSQFPATDRTTYQVVPTMISLAFLGISIWIFGMRRNESVGRAFTLFASSLAIISGTLFDLYTTHYFTYFWTMAVGLTGGALFDFALTFPQEARIVRNRPYVRWLGYVLGLVLVFAAFPTLFNFAQPAAYFITWRILYLFVALTALFFLGLIILRSVRSESPIIRRQARTVLGGTIVAFVPMIGWLLLSVGGPVNFPIWTLASTVIFPLVTGYTVLRYNILRTDYVVSRALVYVLMAVIGVGGYAMGVVGLSLLLGEIFPADNPLLIGITVFLLVVLFNPIRSRLDQTVNRAFFRGQQVFEQVLKTFSHDLTRAIGIPDIVRALRRTINEALAPDRIHVYVYDPLNDQYVATPGDDGRSTSDLRFPSGNALVEHLQREHLPLYLTERISLPPGLGSERSRLTLLGAQLLIPLPGEERLNGWIALGSRLSGEPYNTEGIKFLESLGDQAAVAIGRAQKVFDLQQRVNEMNALARVTQGVNITPTFDDVLELIYAQTAQVIPLSDFHITLYSQGGDYYYYAFCLENGERLHARENVALPASEGMAPLVVSTNRTILTQDYARECQAHDVQPSPQGVFAWMGVPLGAGAETIGAVSIASRDSNTNYTRAQLNLLQSIADQTAGAIVKSRLLEETERRAFQLSTLNQITRQLTSTLETEPLLQSILQSAVSILDCEAGSLFLVDEQTGELIFQVAISPVANDLVGRRLPPGSGIVGKAVTSRAPVIVNDAQRSPDWNPSPDKSTGFITHALLAVPMQVKDRVIGVIEVINKKDGLPFVEDDTNLLTAFAGQAAVALDNARLYTLTDQELAARVEELSVMQRIDRELNASLDIDRAMRITLEWAMRQSRAQAGLIGVIDEDGVRVMAQQGYPEEGGLNQGDMLAADKPAIREALSSGQPFRARLNPESGGSYLPEARSQVVVPIRREDRAIGLMLLESQSDEAGEDMGFLTRLGDHAAIAIANAQLYAAVQAANIAKSEFVSFVAHELKNPMTSIKGYTELLAGGAVGQVSEMQANFLNTIRSNVERMSTLVSDLNDNSKIEAGRLRLDFKAVNLADVIGEVQRSTSRQVEEKRQTLGVELPDSLPQVWADQVRLAQIITNLVSNAHKYTPEEGAIVIGAEAADNQWDTSESAPARVVHVWVRDNGIGISVEDQVKIFQKFFRSEDQKAREAPGTGLGLNITRSLVEMQGGRIWFESEYRKGTTFHFTVPVSES